jgi:hypothetical protein
MNGAPGGAASPSSLRRAWHGAHVSSSVCAVRGADRPRDRRVAGERPRRAVVVEADAQALRRVARRFPTARPRDVRGAARRGTLAPTLDGRRLVAIAVDAVAPCRSVA